MSRICQPVNQIRLTNVSIVRLRQGPNTFELACYPNKVPDWRAGKETDISEVLQSDKIFTCVAKGQFARDAELIGTFGTANFHDCVRAILEKGTIQLSAKERELWRKRYQKEVFAHSVNKLILLNNVNLTVDILESLAQQAGLLPKPNRKLPPKALAGKFAKKLVNAYPEKLGIIAVKAKLDLPNLAERAKWYSALVELGALSINAPEDDTSLTFYVTPGDLPAVEAAIHDKYHILIISEAATIPVDELNKSHSNMPAKSKKENAAGEDEEEDGSGSSSSSEDEEDEVVVTANPIFGKRKQANNMFSNLSDDESDTAEPRTAVVDEEGESEEEDAPEVTAEDLLDRRDLLNKEKLKAKKNREKERKAKEKQKLAKKEMSSAAEPEPEPVKEASPNSATWCKACEVDFALPPYHQTIRQHVKSEWHTFNQKRLIRGLKPVTEAMFNELTADMKEGFLAIQY